MYEACVCGQLAQDVCRAVCRMVIDNDDVVAEGCLLGKGGDDGVADGSRPVEDGDDNGGLDVELLLVEIGRGIVVGIDEGVDVCEVCRGGLLHLCLYLAVLRIDIVKLPLVLLPAVGLSGREGG